MTSDLAVCECGHVYDEHDDGEQCQAEHDGEQCWCVAFDDASDDEGGTDE